MPTLTDLDLPAFKFGHHGDSAKAALFHADFLTDRSDRTVALGYSLENPNEWMHVYLQDEIFCSVRYTVDTGRCTLVEEKFGGLMKAVDLIPETLVINASDREFGYKFIEECGVVFFVDFDLTHVGELPTGVVYQAPTLEDLQKVTGL